MPSLFPVFGQILLSESRDWSLIRYDVMDTLYLSPFKALVHGDDASFILYPKLARAFRRVCSLARQQKPDIKIIPMHMMSDKEGYSQLTTDGLRDSFTTSVANYVAASQGTPLQVDGYNVDYEACNVQDYAGTILSQIRAKLGPKYEVSATPATPKGLEKSAETLNWINMQNYDGGGGTDDQTYLQAIKGLKPAQLAWGISTEGTSSKRSYTIDGAIDMVRTRNLGGIWAWRLNSDDWIFENMCQVSMYNKVHSIPSPGGLDDLVEKGWDNRGFDRKRKPLPGYTKQDWVNNNMYRDPSA